MKKWKVIYFWIQFYSEMFRKNTNKRTFKKIVF